MTEFKRIAQGLAAEYNEMDGIITISNDDRILGMISANPGDWQLILDGANPIEDGWEDGIGNSLSYNGWGEFKQEAE